MSKIKIVICSVLKPVNDARMYEKFGISIAEAGNYEVHIIGYPSSIPKHPNIHFYPLSTFKRISWGRFCASWKISKIISKVKPKVTIVNTHELLIVALKSRILFGMKILYDVQENYFRNIWYQNNFPVGIKHVLAMSTALKEILISPFLSYKILAEEKYNEELPFVGKNSITILNKYQPLEPIAVKKIKEQEKLRFLYSGTISEVYGIKEAIKFFQAIKRIKSSTLNIIGHCTSDEVFEYINKHASSDEDISLNVSKSPVDHQKIIATFPFVDFALTPYHSNPSLNNCIPVKFYEYIAHKVPIVVPDFNEYWKRFLDPFGAAIYIDYSNYTPENIVSRLVENNFYPVDKTKEVLWESEKQKLLNILATLKR